MRHTIEPVDPGLLIEANNTLSAGEGQGDALVTLVSHFRNRLDPTKLLAVNYRLTALAKYVRDDQASPWTTHAKGRPYTLVNEALFRAAATTPLSIGDHDPIDMIAFDPDAFMRRALSESETSGSA